MTVTPIRLGPISVFAVGTSDVSICSPPAGTGVILKHIQWTNTDTVTHYVCLSIGANVAATRIVDQIPIAANSEYARFVAHVMKNADILCPGADTAAKTFLTIRADLL